MGAMEKVLKLYLFELGVKIWLAVYSLVLHGMFYMMNILYFIILYIWYSISLIPYAFQSILSLYFVHAIRSWGEKIRFALCLTSGIFPVALQLTPVRS